MELREWQTHALKLWEGNGHRGIISVVTGGGKTIFALACIQKLLPKTTVIVVPTETLQDQWNTEAAAFFGLRNDDIHLIKGKSGIRSGTINIGIINSVAKLDPKSWPKDCFLIVDECHKAASQNFSKIFDASVGATLGLSATPDREYDDGLAQTLVPNLGKIIFEYTYNDALKDKVIVPFELKNIVFDLEPECQQEYDKVTRAIAKSIKANGLDDERTVSLMLKRARILNLSLARIQLALKILAKHRNEKVIIFHEDISACDMIGSFLDQVNVQNVVYHSNLPRKNRLDALSDFRAGSVGVLITCRALDEGFNVPEAQIGIISASTATRRQRIQRLGRVLRPAVNKNSAIVYSLVCTAPEIERLRDEEAVLDGVANISWSRA